MSPKFAELRAEVLRLPEQERVRMAEELLDSVEQSDAALDEVKAAWTTEIARRLKSLDDGTAVLINGDEHERRLRAKYDL